MLSCKAMSQLEIGVQNLVKRSPFSIIRKAGKTRKFYKIALEFISDVFKHENELYGKMFLMDIDF